MQGFLGAISHRERRCSIAATHRVVILRSIFFLANWKNESRIEGIV